mmetsp:Transcript_89735/g.141693  ORF Transcript_89735/g.141693 Transcript_89735/m.141693 type:complete len:150 (-) Transcript_89735:31-480(-)|eukprot:CAMPEP_0169119932 /NCGR_PEP_ID=MMETSP1015-20121227/31829_1 /TAXON_ID=342587 /ORGANISM="Karlodinium micrum, Strain CCMP2283" /LENGTH=149 /DNA_ID=CAMNT_0009182863 /DNA_START=80 /DNA_END=529 /DNA_ORIENTATION=+
MGQLQACCNNDSTGAKDIESVANANDKEGGKPAASSSSKPNAPPPSSQAAPDMAAPKQTNASEGFVIEFRDNDSQAVKKAFTKKPLGMTFDNKVPLVVRDVKEDSVAAELGIKVGWEFKVIGGVSLEGKEFNECLSLIQTGVQSLPERP